MISSNINAEQLDKVIAENDPIQSMIEEYKELISKTQLKNEIYKWELVNKFRGRPNTEAKDFYQEIKDIEFDNLIYQMGKAVIRNLTKAKPEEIRQLFIELYDETKDLTDRVESFNKLTLKLYRDLGETLSHHQDERSIATYLTFHDSDKYTFYKHSYYNKYCKLLGIKQAKKNERYTHYLTLVEDLIEKYIATDTDLIEQVKSYIPDYYDYTNHKLLAQDILFQMLDKEKEINYWIFQGNPELFDYETALKQEILIHWTVSAHKDKIKVGDKVILWITGNEAGCYALAEVTSNPHEQTSSPDESLWKVENMNTLKADIKITHNLIDNPILKVEIEKLEELKYFKAGNQGTNFSATEKEYLTILKLIEEDNDFQKIKNKFDSVVFNNYIQLLRNIISELNIQPNDKRIVYSVRNYNLNFTVGQRYCFAIYFSHAKGVYGVISKDKLNDRSELYEGNLPQPYYTRINDFDIIQNEWNTIIEGINGELNRTNKSGFNRYNNSDFENYVFEAPYVVGDTNVLRDTIETTLNDETMKLSKNTILYGPPGTGKTYILKNKYMDMFTTTKSTITRQEFIKDILQKCPWWQVIALAVLEIGKTKVPALFKHEYVQIKAQLSNSTTIIPTIWGQLQSHTIEECENVKVQRKMQPLIFKKSEKSEWEVIYNEVEEQAPELIELKSRIDNFERLPHIKIERFEFLTFHQSYAYEDFIEGIKPKLEESEVAYEIEEGVFQKLCNRARNDATNNYAIFIDEINRGNISSIFGELITLIEDDKREGELNEIKAILPYSKKHFSVPRNLYIIGTMNTADRSVEALDTALRRRFSFIEMNPDPSILSLDEFICTNIDLAAMLTAINARIEKLLDKDYCIGHSYFMTIKNRSEPLEEIKSIFLNKILPLLQEYFYGNWGKIQLIIGKEFVEIKKESINFLSVNNYEDYEEYDDKPIYNFTHPSAWTIDSFKSIYE